MCLHALRGPYGRTARLPRVVLTRRCVSGLEESEPIALGGVLSNRWCPPTLEPDWEVSPKWRDLFAEILSNGPRPAKQGTCVPRRAGRTGLAG